MGLQRQWCIQFLLSLGLVACSQAKIQQSAPRSQAEAGVIIKGTSDQTQLVLSNSSAYRVLNQKHHLYEVHGMTIEEVRTLSPQLDIIEVNTYVDGLTNQEGQSLTADWTQLAELDDLQESLPPILDDCQLGYANQGPTPSIQPLSENLMQSVTIQLGERVTFSGTGSRATTIQRPITEYRWQVLSPTLSLLDSDLVQRQEEIEFTPDAVGTYHVVLVAKDRSRFCGIQQIRFFVTYNPEYVDAASDLSDLNLLDTLFTHLNLTRTPEAWSHSTGTDITVAVLDTGINFNHPSIQQNLRFNPHESSRQPSLDQDENGFSGDYLGWDFANGDNNPFDDDGHGSHVSGLIASSSFGVAKRAKILPLKVLNAGGGGDTASIAAGIYYAVDNGARIINASLQRITRHVQILEEAIAYADSHGVAVVTSAGNSGLDLGQPGINSYPGSLPLANIVNVAASDLDGELAEYSNFGSSKVHVLAPGGEVESPIFSLTPQNPRGVKLIGRIGTSMAAPQVAGLIAILMEENPNLSIEEIREILYSTGQEISGLQTKVQSSRLIDVEEARQMAQEFHLRNHIF